MTKTLQTMKLSFSAAFLAGIQISVLVAVVASQIGERVIRGAQGFAIYRDAL